MVMLRILTAVAFAVLAATAPGHAEDQGASNLDDPAAVVVGGPAQTAGTAPPVMSYGVFREIRPDSPVDQRNCWIQGLVDGKVIRGELLADKVTYTQAQCVLLLVTRRGLCAGQRTSPLWSNRAEQNSSGDSAAGSRGAGGGGEPTNLNVQSWNQVHAYPGRTPRGNLNTSGIDPDSVKTGSATNSPGTDAGSGNGLGSDGPSPQEIDWASLGCARNPGKTSPRP
jgi:hypothetical protein